jgi:hypothetical protein
MKRPRHRYVQIHLPPLTGEQAYILAAILERAVSAIWRAHGDDMADFQGRVFPDAPPNPDPPTTTDYIPGLDDELF